MELIKAFQEIESHEFAARVGVASQFTTFLRIASSDHAVKDLLQCSNDIEVQSILCRLMRLASQKADPRYANPYDAALTVYFWLLSSKDDARLTGIAAESILGCSNLWWASRLARSWEAQPQQSKTCDSETIWENAIPQSSIANPYEGEGVYGGFLAEILRTPVILRKEVSSRSNDSVVNERNQSIPLASQSSRFDSGPCENSEYKTLDFRPGHSLAA